MRRYIYFFSIFSVLLLGPLGVVSAQENIAAQESSEYEFTENQKEAFVEAYLKVMNIQQEFRSQLDPEMTQEKMEEVANEANTRIETTIDSVEHMDTEVYRQFLMALKSDTELFQEIQGRAKGM